MGNRIFTWIPAIIMQNFGEGRSAWQNPFDISPWNLPCYESWWKATKNYFGRNGMNILPKIIVVLISEVSFEDDLLQVSLTDGRQIRVPLEWFPKLRDASPEERQN